MTMTDTCNNCGRPLPADYDHNESDSDETTGGMIVQTAGYCPDCGRCDT